MRATRLLLLAAVLTAALVGDAAAAPLTLEARTGAVGWIDLGVTGRAGTTVTVTDESGAQVALIALQGERGGKRRAVPWRCDRQARRLTATAPDERGGTETASAEVRTPGCGERLAIAVRPFAPRARGRVLVRVRDHWRLGAVSVPVCLQRRCRTARIRRGRATDNVWLRTRGPGIRTVTAAAPWGQRVQRVLEVRRRPVTVLATGDSMIQIVDSHLRQRLRPRGARLRSDARISTGISKPFQLDWVALARRQALALHPTATVMFIGANDGFPIGGADCCGAEWIQRYAARVRRMMDSYERNGVARVYWLTLPAPRKESFARVFRAVNAALHLAEPALAGSGRIIDLARVFTPRGRFQSTLHGQVVRQPDGVHLNVRGAAIAAAHVIRVLRRDGVVR